MGDSPRHLGLAKKSIALLLAMTILAASPILLARAAEPQAIQGEDPNYVASPYDNVTNIEDVVNVTENVYGVTGLPSGGQMSDMLGDTILAMGYRPLKIFLYDDYEEDSYAGSIREYLVGRGHTVVYMHDQTGYIDVMASYPNFDVIVAEHTCDDGTLVNLQQWFRAGKGYVALIGSQMYNDPPQDDYIMNLLGVGLDGNIGSGWWPAELGWTIANHPIKTFPNSAWSVNSLPNGQYRYYVGITGGQAVISGPGGAVLQTRSNVEGAGRIAYWGSNYHNVDRTNTNVRQFVENMIVWASMAGGGQVVVEEENEPQLPTAKGELPTWLPWVGMAAGLTLVAVFVIWLIPPVRRRKDDEKKPPMQNVPPPPS